MSSTTNMTSATDVCELLDRTRTKLVTMLAAVPDASKRAVGHWSIGETAAHLCTVTALDAFVAADIEPPDELAPVVDRSRGVSLGEVAGMNALTLECVRDRDTQILASRIDATIDAILDAAPAIDWNGKVHWLGGLTATPAGVLGHLISELLIHGLDIARAAHLSYPMSPDAARAFFETFLIDVLESPEIAEFGKGRGSSAEGLSWQLGLR